MPHARRAGQLRGRTRRADELRQVAAIDPELHQILVELRRTHPPAFRKELDRLVREGVIPSGRKRTAPAELLAALERPLIRAQAAVDQAAADGDLDFRVLEALIDEERGARRRPALIEWLEQARERMLAADNRKPR